MNYFRNSENDEIYSIPKSATVSYELRNFDSCKNRISPFGWEKAETSQTADSRIASKTNIDLIRPRILSSPGSALANTFAEEESEPVYANLNRMAPSEEEVPGWSI
jgi:hypothetical protein